MQEVDVASQSNKAKRLHMKEKDVTTTHASRRRPQEKPYFSQIFTRSFALGEPLVLTLNILILCVAGRAWNIF